MMTRRLERQVLVVATVVKRKETRKQGDFTIIGSLLLCKQPPSLRPPLALSPLSWLFFFAPFNSSSLLLTDEGALRLLERRTINWGQTGRSFFVQEGRESLYHLLSVVRACPPFGESSFFTPAAG